MIVPKNIEITTTQAISVGANESRLSSEFDDALFSIRFHAFRFIL